MKNAIYALVLAPGIALAAPAAPTLRLVDDALLITVPRLPGADCPARIATVSMTEAGRPGTFWASQRLAAPVEHQQTSTCSARVGLDSWAGKLRDGQRLAALAVIANRRSPALHLVTVCSDEACTLAEANQTIRDCFPVDPGAADPSFESCPIGTSRIGADIKPIR